MRISLLVAAFPLFSPTRSTAPLVPQDYQLNIMISIDPLKNARVIHEVVFIGDYLEAGIITAVEPKTASPDKDERETTTDVQNQVLSVSDRLRNS
jgi:hypothetical protein